MGAVAVVACAVFGSSRERVSHSLYRINDVSEIKGSRLSDRHTAALLASCSLRDINHSTLMILYSWVEVNLYLLASYLH